MPTDLTPSRGPAPVNPIPAVIALLFAIIVVVEVAVTLGAREIIGGPAAIGWRLEAIQRFAFSGAVFDWMVAQGQWPVEQVWRFVTYPFVHASFTHAAIAGVMVLALGKMVGDAFGGWAAFVLFIVPSVLGAVIFALLTATPAPLMGAFPAVYGLIGGYTFLMWVQLGRAGDSQLRAFQLIGFLMALQLVFGMIYGADPTWIADIAAFVVGLILAPVLAPGGWHRLVAKLRRD